MTDQPPLPDQGPPPLHATAASADRAAADPPRSRRARLFRIAKIALVLLILWGVGRYMWRLTDEWREEQAKGARIDWSPGWLIASGVLYVLGTACYPLFWQRLLADVGLSASPWAAVRAYFVAGLGKYAPGKAWVVIIRAQMIPADGVGRFTIGSSVFYETFAMMATGGLAAAACLALTAPAQWMYWGGGLAIAAGMSAVLSPPVFSRVAKLVGLPFGGECQAGAPGRWARTALRTSWLPLLGWLGLGLSLPAALLGMGLALHSPGDMATHIGGVALATAAGFIVIFMPSGIGVREVVLVKLLEPQCGAGKAVIASLLLRTIWTVADVAAAGVVYWRRGRMKNVECRM